MRAPTRHFRLVAAVALLLSAASCQRETAVARPPEIASVKCVTGNAPDVARPEALPAAALSADEPAAIHPCKAKTPEWEAASKAADAIAARVDALADDGDPKLLEAELDRLLATPCFELSAGDPHDDSSFDSAISLKAWWDDGGGSWVDHYLARDETRHSVVSPTRRRSLTSGSAKAKRHPLAPLLCPPSAARLTDATGCGHETNGWVKRANASLARWAAKDLLGSTVSTPEGCAKAALSREVSADQRYGAYRECIEHVPLRHDALPLGRFKAPTDGWFVIAGGSPSRCTDLATYDLASGAAYRVSDCRGRRHGSAPALVTALGRLPVPLLREAVWMILLAQVSEQQVLTEATTFDVPKEIAIGRARGSGRGGTGGFGCGSSAPRSWSWMRDRSGSLAGQASGILEWPTGCGGADGHATELLEIAEDSFDEGCTPAPAPARIPWSAPGPAIEHERAAVIDDPILETMRAELAKVSAKKRVPCPK